MPCIPVSIPEPMRNPNEYLQDNCLLAIFEYLPLADLFALNKICTRFGSLRATVLSRRQSLTLVIGDEWNGFVSEFSNKLHHDGTQWFGPNMDTQNTKMRFEVLTKEVCDFLARLMPNVTRLQVMQSGISSKTLDQVNYLVSKWALQMTTFKFGARFCESRLLSREASEEMISQNLAVLITLINHLPELRCLSLQLHHRLLPGANSLSNQLDVKPVDLPVLSQLEEVYLLTNDRAAVFYDSIKRYAEPNKELARLGLQCCVDAVQFFRSKHTKFSPEFANKFVAIDLGRAKLKQTEMDSLGGQFKQLTSLGLNLTMPISMLPTWLRSCKQLRRLHLYIHMASYMRSQAGAHRSVSRSREASVSSRTSSSTGGPKMSQIEALTVTLACEQHESTHLDLVSLQFEKTFPSLQMFEYIASATCCTICHLRANAGLEQRRKCHGITLALLDAAMPKCKVVYYLDV